MTTSESKTALETEDPEVFAIIKDEEQRQTEGLELIASEVRRHPCRVRACRGAWGSGHSVCVWVVLFCVGWTLEHKNYGIAVSLFHWE